VTPAEKVRAAAAEGRARHAAAQREIAEAEAARVAAAVEHKRAVAAHADRWVAERLPAEALAATAAGKSEVYLSTDDAKAEACKRAGLEVKSYHDNWSGHTTWSVLV
jgi:hypothetical protein